MLILGIDPSLTCTGWAVISKILSSEIKYIDSGFIKTKADEKMQDRLLKITEILKKVVETHKIKTSFMEETFVNKNSQSSLKVGMVRGAIMLILAQCDVENKEFMPTAIKKTITGNGKADKEQVLYMIKQILPQLKDRDITKLDESDAIAIALCGAIY